MVQRERNGLLGEENENFKNSTERKIFFSEIQKLGKLASCLNGKSVAEELEVSQPPVDGLIGSQQEVGST